MGFTQKTQRAIAKYGQSTCDEAFIEHRAGNGARTVGIQFGLTTNQADAAINAGRERANSGETCREQGHNWDWWIRGCRRCHAEC